MKRFGHVQFAARSDVGKKRKNNEDALGAFPSSGMFCVADGMGGGDDGEIASAAVVKAVEDAARLCVPPEEGGYAAADVADVLENHLNKASEWIFNRTTEKKLSGCGSTFVGVVLDATHPEAALAVHAGDSRLYLLRGRAIKQITRDHSAAEMIGAKDESKLNPLFRSMVMNAVGIRAKVEPERTPFKVAEGDRILICSDGLSRMVPDKKILSISRQHKDVGDAVEAMILAALEAGGIDNVTVLLAEIGPLPEPAKALPMPESAAGFEDEDTDTGSTDGPDEDTVGSTQTLQTLQPMVVQTKLDLAKDVAVARTTVQTKGARSRAILIAVSVGVVLAAVVGVIAWRLAKPEPVPAAPAPTAKPVTEAADTTAPHSTNAAETVVVEPVTNAVKTVVVEPVTNAVKTVVVEVATNDAKTATAHAEKTPIVVTNSAPKVVQDAVCTNLIAVCDVSHIGSFKEKMRRLFPKGNPPSEYRRLIEAFETNAKECSRMRSAKDAEKVTVDMKFMLQAAEAAKDAFKAKAKDPAVLRWLADWEKIVSGDSKDISVQEACARLILSSKEVLAR